MDNHVRPLLKVVIMKKLSLFLALMCIIFTSASAETGYYSIGDLPTVTAPSWVTQYNAAGRTIEVDVDVVIPQANHAPVISKRPWKTLVV